MENFGEERNRQARQKIVTETTVGMLEARQKLTHLLGTARFGGHRHVLTSHGVEYGAIIGLDDLQRLRDLDAKETGEKDEKDETRFATLDSVA